MVGFNKLDVLEKRLEQIATKLEHTGSAQEAEELDKRVTALEKVVVRANVIWAAVSIAGGLGFQLFLHLVGK